MFCSISNTNKNPRLGSGYFGEINTKHLRKQFLAEQKKHTQGHNVYKFSGNSLLDCLYVNNSATLYTTIYPALMMPGSISRKVDVPV